MDNPETVFYSRAAIQLMLPALLLVCHPFNARPVVTSLKKVTMVTVLLHTVYAVLIDVHCLSAHDDDDMFFGGLCALMLLFSLMTSFLFASCTCPKLGGGAFGFLGALALGLLLFTMWWLPTSMASPAVLTVAAMVSTGLACGLVYRLCG